MATRTGRRNLLLMQSHIAHDCVLGDDNVVANGAMFGEALDRVRREVPRTYEVDRTIAFVENSRRGVCR